MIKQGFIELSTSNQQILTPDQAWHFGIIPKEVSLKHAAFYIDETRAGPDIEEALALLLEREITLQKTDADIISSSLAKYYRKNGNSNALQKVSGCSSQDDLLGKLIREAK